MRSWQQPGLQSLHKVPRVSCSHPWWGWWHWAVLGHPVPGQGCAPCPCRLAFASSKDMPFLKIQSYFDCSWATPRSSFFSSSVLCVQFTGAGFFLALGTHSLKRTFSLGGFVSSSSVMRAVRPDQRRDAQPGTAACSSPPGSEPAALTASPHTCLRRGEQLSHKRCCA